MIKGLIERGLPIERVVTTVTRLMRPGEAQGRPYYFISINEFKEMIKADRFVEWAKVYGDYRGCSFDELERVEKSGKVGIWKVDYQGVKTVKEKIKDVVAIYIKPPSLEVSVKRIKKRKLDSEEEIKKRMAYVRDWLREENDKLYDYIVVNKEGRLDETVDKVVEIISSK